MPISFLSEHSAEFVLVPRIVSLLKPHFQRVIPIYFWASREGSSISRACDPQKSVRVINVFARRPKITQPNQDVVEVKFNHQLFETAHISASFGVPTFAGVPLTTSLFDFSLSCNCALFELFSRGPDVTLELSITGDILACNRKPARIRRLDDAELVKRVSEKSAPSSWGSMIDNLRDIRRGTSNDVLQGYPFWFGGYRPFQLILIDA